MDQIKWDVGIMNIGSNRESTVERFEISMIAVAQIFTVAHKARNLQMENQW